MNFKYAGSTKLKPLSRFNRQRRQFLKVGLLGSATLTLASCGVMLNQQPKTSHNYLWLNFKDQKMLSAIIPVMLIGALPKEKSDYDLSLLEIIKGIDISIAHMPKAVREEVRQLFSLLENPIMRVLLVGLWASWEKADANDIRNFLTSWQTSGFDLLRVGYTALHDLISGSWYANPRAWPRIQYPGPPVI